MRLTAHAIEQYIARFRPALTTVQAHQELRSLLKDARYSGPAVSGGDYYRCPNGLTVVVKHDRGPLCVTVVPPAGERPEFPPVPPDLEGASQEDQRVDALRAIHAYLRSREGHGDRRASGLLKRFAFLFATP